MKTIAFDVMGNDYGLKNPIQAAIKFCKFHLDYYVILVGDRSKIIKYVKETEKIKILDAKKVITPLTPILSSLRDTETSMYKAIELVVNNKADVVLSAGSSKHYLSLLTIMLGKLNGVSRPAFLSILPTINKGQKVVLLDVGANIQVEAQQLVEWAKLGSVFSNKILHIIKPRIGLNNIGIEKNKGMQYHIEANKKLVKTKKLII